MTKNPQDAFFASLSERCGKAYAGRLASNQEADAEMRGKAMVMHIRHCTPDAGFTYGLDRQGRHFRVAFDYAKPVTPPPAPWGW
ncbi:MAG: hypothetical protein EOP63_16345 [Sphingomonadales bacterium]|nr:MAG: hypothetical protein EOP63_16345 [Sphingomonadales bacterium]